MNNRTEPDSLTMGTPAKSGALKIYFNLKELSDDEAKALVKRAVGLHKFLMEINQ
jgi:hypothetical protein